MTPTALLLALGLPSAAHAQAPQYRKLSLTDGREIRAEVLSTEPTGLRMRMPQGETLISFEILMDMVPIQATEYRDQPPMRIWVRSPNVADELARIYAAIPSVEVITSTDPKGLEPGVIVQLEECDTDLDCMAKVMSAAGRWAWLVAAAPPTDATPAAVVLRSRTSGEGAQFQRTNAPTAGIGDLWVAAHTAVSLIPPPTVPKVVLTGEGPVDPRPNRKSWTLESASAVTAPRLFVPGLASFQQGDSRRGAIGLGVGALGTGLVVGTVAAVTPAGERGGKPLQLVGVGLGSWVALGAFTNAWLGTASFNDSRVAFSLQPTPGGALVGFTRPL